MARYKPIDMVKYYQGKICKHSDTYFQKRRRTLCTGKICQPRTKPFTAEELARQNKFRQAVEAVKNLSEEQKEAYATAFALQTKYAYLRNYMIAQEYAKIS